MHEGFEPLVLGGPSLRDLDAKKRRTCELLYDGNHKGTARVALRFSVCCAGNRVGAAGAAR